MAGITDGETVVVTGSSIPGDITQGVVFPKDYNLVSLNMLGGNQSTLDLRPLLIELSYYEDIFSNFVSGELLVQDSLGVIEKYNLHGNEYIRMVFSKDGGKNKIDKLFRVYKISRRQKTFAMDSEIYCIQLCSDALFMSEQYTVSKSYPSMDIAQIVRDIFENYLHLQVGADFFSDDIEQTSSTYDIVIPNLKPFEAVNWLASMAISGNNGNIGSDILFFQNNDGFNFKSLQTMFKQDPANFNNYEYRPKNLPLSAYTQKGTDKNIFNILSYEFIDTFDTLEGVITGTLITFDPLLRRFDTRDFDYSVYATNARALNPNMVINNMVNRNKQALYDTPMACVRLSVTNKTQKDSSYVNNRFYANPIQADRQVETTLPLRRTQLSLSNYHRVKFYVGGDPRITVGDTINFNILTQTPAGDDIKKTLDPFYSGKYLITAVRHMIQPTAYTSVVEIAKDSNPKSYNVVDQNSTLVTNTVKGSV